MKDFSFVTNSHPSYIEEVYKDFVKDPSTVDPEMKKFFEGVDFACNNGFASPSKPQHSIDTNGTSNMQTSGADMQKEFGVYQLIRAYRKRGHLISTTNPIRKRIDRHAHLELVHFGLSDNDLNTVFAAGRFCGLAATTLGDILAHLQKIYTSTVGVEYTYINSEDICKWVEVEFEKIMTQDLPLVKKKRILEKLNQGVIFEKFLHTKFIGQKRFSLEGGESTIAALDAIITEAANNDVQEVVMGMAHRGRLNILANILQKTYEQIFTEFEGNVPTDSTMGSGDVKYHLGFKSDVLTLDNKKINLQLTPNPSHLEAVNPLVEGFTRAKADTLYKSDFDKILPILIHGDASIAGQGIVYEVLQMSNLNGYYTGGTIHFVINNQIGFTTNFDDARSADYCTSIASMVQAPVFHVNGDDPEAVVKVSELALRFRQKFNRDVFIDMVCYRRHGHNEGDDPKFTQPAMYNVIDKHQNPREVYSKKLSDAGEVDGALAKEMEKIFWKDLQDRLDEVKQKPLPYKQQLPELAWAALRKSNMDDFHQSVDTTITKEVLEKVFNAIMQLPADFVPLKKVQKLLDEKNKLFHEQQTVDWATGELLAYGSLLMEGHDVRMSGQDVERGTFSHRHAVLYDEVSNNRHNRLSKIDEQQGIFRIYNSLLSEYAVLGFEYGYAMANPNTLVIWEAQFGDFCNGAQTIIDQFIASAETKWGKMNGMVMLLPHGYEGQGPEHSSARMERFLQLCAEQNMYITNCTTAANFFHVLRRQVTQTFRKPLINFSPKANLRLVKAYSKIEEFTKVSFQEVIDDSTVTDFNSIKRVLLCSGKVYYDLLEYKMTHNRNDVAIVRLEQIHPLPAKQLMALYSKYKNAQWIWVQEEPSNMGAYSFLKMNIDAKVFNLGYLSRQASASTATGYAKKHAEEQKLIIESAFS
ncbi:MAG: 2-oxoglutarate dehydrogenase E1 component [Bacteroidetes bacterium]|jgi:2-oxoglutarate dehydrogenase E1 component|nr:2-oxoglutarate dehydrogenase E1 component [Bacteroidota bacterium]MBK6821265.1 2-oxoglutarate dehydrogenase E1 component [Bacteroidota bacterium]MBK7040185.1 2-oxoglutarate dehydrogenase E1 component [Bacteroidota bacterium]MBK8330384.1 2-oxoglutarate dehydrogenase E1 component [Bacteroidota bacterium]MBK9481930.1 2-oxoglutarate dehydrogenase E1 component [Bacteroidota bacterium]